MAAGPPLEPGTRSPDGMWWWDGRQWVPVMSPGLRPRRSRAWIGWLAGGCVFLVLLFVGAGAYGVYTLGHGGFSCLPSDFPKYPGATFGGISASLNGPTPGNYCEMILDSRDAVGAVRDFYASKLDSGDWQVTATDVEMGTISFRSTRRTRTTGTVAVASRGSYTEITIQLYS